MKKFDISNLAVTNIDGIYRSALAMDSEAKTTARTSLLIVKKAGRSSYDINGVRYTADKENVLFIPKGTEYDMYIEREGECTVIELTVEDAEKLPVSVFFTGGDAAPHIAPSVCPSFTDSSPTYPLYSPFQAPLRENTVLSTVR